MPVSPSIVLINENGSTLPQEHLENVAVAVCTLTEGRLSQESGSSQRAVTNVNELFDPEEQFASRSGIYCRHLPLSDCL